MAFESVRTPDPDPSLKGRKMEKQIFPLGSIEQTVYPCGAPTFPQLYFQVMWASSVCVEGRGAEIEWGGYQDISLNKDILPKLFSKKTG